MSEPRAEDRHQATAIRWVDSHCHVHDPRTPDGSDAAVALAADSGVTTLITVGCDRETSQAAIDVAGAHRGVHATVGLHPHDAVNGVDTIVDLLDVAGVVAVGEAGLDYYYDHSPREVQQRVFEEQIQLANDRDLPLVIHSRDAWDDTFDALASVGVPTRTIFHCFTGGPDEARRALDIGALLSFSGIVTFKGAPEVQAAAILCPLDRMLVETASPHPPRVPHPAKPTRPAGRPHDGQHNADLRAAAVTDTAAAPTPNAELVFAL